MTLPANAEALVTEYLRDDPAVSALVAARVYTVIPSGNASWPLLRVVRIGGVPAFSRPLHLDRASLQIDAFGGSKAQALTLADTARMALSEIDLAMHSEGVVTGIEFGPLAYVPDPDFEPAKPRYLFDVTLTLHP
jgi:hypothetical protein